MPNTTHLFKEMLYIKMTRDKEYVLVFESL